MEEKESFTREEVAQVYRGMFAHISVLFRDKIHDCIDIEDFESAANLRDTRIDLHKNLDTTFNQIGFSELPF